METPTEPSPLKRLRRRQVLFVGFIAQGKNQTEAARLAGYSETAAENQGYRLMRNDDVRLAISEMMERYSMSVGEAVGKMSMWARGSLAPFLTETGDIDLHSDQAKMNLPIVKKYKKRKTTTTGENDFISVTETVEIELYDAKDATDKILQLHGRYKQLPGDAGQPKTLQGYELPDGTKIIF